MPDTLTSPDIERWSGVETAYDFVLPSYALLVNRYDAADNRLTALLSLLMTLTLGAPILAKTIRPTLSFASGWFVLALVYFAIASVAGVMGRLRGHLTLVNPRVLYEHSLTDPPWEFKKNAVYFAGQHFDANARAIDRKSVCSVWLTIALLLEIVSFLLWIAL